MELRQWIEGRAATDLVLGVPNGLLRILNRDLEAAGIDKIDGTGRRVYLHAISHSTGTHLSIAGAPPRTAQAIMRHGDIRLTMNTHTDERLRDKSGAVELVPTLRPIGRPVSKTPSAVPRMSRRNLATGFKKGSTWQVGRVRARTAQTRKNPQFTENYGLFGSGAEEI